MKLSRQKILFFFFIILLINGILGYTVYKSNEKHIISEQWVEHSETVSSQSANILSLVLDVETTSRGYIITKDSSFLEPLYIAQKTIFGSIGRLRQLVQDNPIQQQYVDSIRFYVQKRLDFTLHTIEIRNKKGLTSAIAEVSKKQGKQDTDHIRRIIKAFQKEEANLLKQRMQDNDLKSEMFNWAIVIMFFTMDVFAILLFFAFRNILIQNEEKEKRDAELIIANKELAFQNEEKEKRAAELAIANKELAFQNEEKEKRAAELAIAKDKAELSNYLKSSFLANMSHEIRTPMNGILGFTELLKKPDLSGEKQEQYISMIEKGGMRMLNIINDIISISKVESGLMEVLITETNVNEQIEYIYTFFKPEVERKGMQISYHNSLPAKEAVVKTDREKVYAILTNLVKNAIKFSDAGTIEFGYNLKAICKPVNNMDHEPAELEFFVKDTGVGIPKGRKKAVFERFVQADITDKRAFQGAGLGLSISKAYVELLGGKIWVESEEGKGSTFYFTIPYNTISEEIKVIENVVSRDEEGDQIKKLNILIADDDEPSTILLTEIVKEFGKKVLCVSNGCEAVGACRSNPDIDIVLIDIQMPKMDGYKATKLIRQFNKDVIIIAQTAYALMGDREKAMDAGCNDYVSKPLNQALLMELIEKYLNKS